MREVINILVGQCGNNVGCKYWEMICKEHGINSNGIFSGNSDIQLNKIGVSFHETSDKAGRFVPRSVLIDLDPMTVNNVTNSKYGKIFRPDNFISSITSASNNFAKGYYTDGPDILDNIMEVIRKETESCENVQTFQMFHSISGGTGSGVGSLIFDKLNEEYPDRILVTATVFPSSTFSETVTESYNALLSINHLMENTNMVKMFDNEALFSLNSKILKIKCPTFGDANFLISLSLSSITTNLRFPGILNIDYRKICVNLVPYPKFTFLISSFAPLSESMVEGSMTTSSLHNVTMQGLDCHNLMVSCDPRNGKYIALATMYRGRTSIHEIENEVLNFQNKNSSFFIDWIPSNVKISSCDIPPAGIRLSMTSLGNNTSIQDIFNQVTDHYAFMFRRKAFLHWYTSEGVEEDEFHLAEDNTLDLIDDYQRINGRASESSLTNTSEQNI